MREIERYGVKIDVCQSSGGIWLDRGELEKIMMMIRQEALQEAQVAGAASAPPPPPSQQAYARQDHDRRDYDDRRERPRKKRDGVLDNLMDIFDF